jgi:hypothetical protein
MKANRIIGIYENNESETLAHIVETIEQASRWIGCGMTTLYDALHRDGFMNAKGYKLEIIELNEEELNNGNL